MTYITKNPVIKQDFAVRLKNLRRAAHLTQEQIAGQLGIRRKTYSEWENKSSDTLPSNLNVMVAMCEILDTTEAYLLRGLFESRRERRHEERYLDLYSRYRNNPDFFLLVGALMELDDEYLKIFSSFAESIYSKQRKNKTPP